MKSAILILFAIVFVVLSLKQDIMATMATHWAVPQLDIMATLATHWAVPQLDIMATLATHWAAPQLHIKTIWPYAMVNNICINMELSRQPILIMDNIQKFKSFKKKKLKLNFNNATN